MASEGYCRNRRLEILIMDSYSYIMKGSFGLFLTVKRVSERDGDYQQRKMTFDVKRPVPRNNKHEKKKKGGGKKKEALKYSNATYVGSSHTIANLLLILIFL